MKRLTNFPLSIAVISLVLTVSCTKKDGNSNNDSTGTVTDIDGNVYHTVKIGTQVWMVENLKVTHYRNGDPIPNITDSAKWRNLTTGAYCWYKNDIANKNICGALYNWHTVHDYRKIAPVGWHIPTDEEWTILTTFLGGDSIAGGKMKEEGLLHWPWPNTGTTNNSGFTALPGGNRGEDFDYFPYYAFFWSSSPNNPYSAWIRNLNNYDGVVSRGYDYKGAGLSGRCLQD